MDEISYDDFLKLDLRIAKIESTESIPGKTRIIKGIISLGDEKRDVIIGGANFYESDELVGRLVVVIANLESKKMAGVESNAMLLAADLDDKPFWLSVDSILATHRSSFEKSSYEIFSILIVRNSI